jgi:hypothetical protein
MGEGFKIEVANIGEKGEGRRAKGEGRRATWAERSRSRAKGIIYSYGEFIIRRGPILFAKKNDGKQNTSSIAAQIISIWS